MEYKMRLILAGLDRREVARQMGLSYSGLTSRLNSFTAFRVEEEECLRRILKEAEAARQEGVAQNDG